eukprot:471535_1
MSIFRSIEKEENGDYCCSIYVNRKYTNDRSVKWIINANKMHRYEDSSLTPSSSKDTTNIDSKYLINTLKKYLSISVKYCRGITDCTDWFTKDIFGCNRFTCEWINNGNMIVHGNCRFKTQNKNIKSFKCKNCVGLHLNLVKRLWNYYSVN